jgi:hypothetical protein
MCGITLVARMSKLQYCLSELGWESVGGADVEVGNADLWGDWMDS